MNAHKTPIEFCNVGQQKELSLSDGHRASSCYFGMKGQDTMLLLQTQYYKGIILLGISLPSSYPGWLSTVIFLL